MIYGWLVGIFAALLGALTAFARIYKFGPWLHEETPVNDPLPPDTTEVPHVPVEPLKQAPSVSHAKLQLFCAAIRDFEGKPGDLNYKNNNPGNFRCSPVGYFPKYGVVKCVNDFAVFPSYQLGWEYLVDSVQHRADAHPTWTVLDFFENYAPAKDGNNPLAYAKYVSACCGVVPTTRLCDLFA